MKRIEVVEVKISRSDERHKELRNYMASVKNWPIKRCDGEKRYYDNSSEISRFWKRYD